MLEFVGVVALLGLIGLSIGLHELGHLVPAKRFGVKVTEFAIGFGPAIWRGKWGETDLRLRLLPIGGFIRMIGMYAPSRLDGRRVGGWFADRVLDARAASAAEIADGDDQRTFYRLSTPKRLVVMTGGPLMNLVFAGVLFAICLSLLGVQTPTTQVAALVDCVPTLTNPDGDPKSGDCVTAPAAAAGLRAGDRLTAVDGVAVADWLGFSKQLANHTAGDQVVLSVSRADGSSAQLPITLADATYEVLAADGTKTGEVSHRPFIGMRPEFVYEQQPVSRVLPLMWDMTVSSVQALGQFPNKLADLAVRLVSGQPRDPNGPISVVGVTRIGGQIAGSDLSWRSKAFDMLGLAGSLNLFLFLFNLLPLLPLDGGHAFGAIFEAARRRFAAWRHRPDPGPVDIARALPLTYMVTFVLLAASLLVIAADIFTPINLGS